MSDHAGPAVKIPRYAYTLADKNWLLNCSDRSFIACTVDLGTDEADSDEDAADDFQPCTIRLGHALERISALSEFAMSRPNIFGSR
jgi:hypothetical protein